MKLEIKNTKLGLWLDAETKNEEVAERFCDFLTRIHGDGDFIARKCIVSWTKGFYWFNFPLDILFPMENNNV